MSNKKLHPAEIKALKALARINAFNLEQMAQQNVFIKGVAIGSAETLNDLVSAIEQLERELKEQTQQPMEAIA